MRDVALTLIMLVLVPSIFFRPSLGPLAWAWVSMMVPHRLTFGFAYSLPFAQLVGGATLIALFAAKERHRIPWITPIRYLAYFYAVMCFTTIIALNNVGDAFDMWVKVTKVHVMLWVTIALIGGKKQILDLIKVITLSIGFYGIKGGLFTIRSGGGERVWGPTGSFFEGNNELALALVTIMPLMYFMRQTAERAWWRTVLSISLILVAFSVLGSQSRGALLAISAMALILGARSKRPVLAVSLFAIIGISLVAFMPDTWSNRMNTISSHEDHSAQSRLYTWQMILNMVAHNPWGAGFDFWTWEVWGRYAVTEWLLPYSPHSIYFQALGEHGILGFFFYIGMGVTSWRFCGRMIKEVGNDPEQQWLKLLAQCIQISLLSFAVGGTFLGLVNFDVPYYLVAIVGLLWRDCRKVPDAVTAPGAPAVPRPRPAGGL